MSTDPVVLIHAGIADNRMWDAFAEQLGGDYELRRHEMRGFGQTPMPPGSFSMIDDLAAFLDRRSVLVGCSFGGAVALAFTARSPELVSGLVLIDAPVPDHDFSDEITAYWDEETRLAEAGDLDAATALNVRFWVGDADPKVRQLVTDMARRSLELQAAGDPDADPGLPESIDLTQISVPTLVLAGDRDRADFKAIAHRLAGEIPDARLVWIEGAQHLPALERPEATARVVREFVASV